MRMTMTNRYCRGSIAVCDWAREGGDMRDIGEVFARLSQSPFRRRFRLGAKERNYLVAKGLPAILDHAREFTDRRLAPEAPRNDGKQTPFRGIPCSSPSTQPARAAAHALRNGTALRKAGCWMRKNVSTWWPS